MNKHKIAKKIHKLQKRNKKLKAENKRLKYENKQYNYIHTIPYNVTITSGVVQGEYSPTPYITSGSPMPICKPPKKR